MGGVIAYSGLVTKVHALSSNLLKMEHYDELLAATTFNQAMEVLRTKTNYRHAFADMPDADFHREAVERRLTESLYMDYLKLYRFSDRSTKEFLDIYFTHFEVLLIKQCLRNVRNLASPDVTLGCFEEFFRRHSHVDLDKMNHSDTIGEFMPALAGSEYEKLLMPIFMSGCENLLDYEVALDLHYFSKVWKLRGLVGRDEQEVIRTTFGTKIDLLNLQWIYRSKKYYNMDSAIIYSMLIPVNHKLRDAQVRTLINAQTPEEFDEAFNATKYARFNPGDDPGELFGVMDDILAHIYKIQSRKHPFSVAPIMKYLYFKEEEIEQLTTILEGIRYSRAPQNLTRFIPAFVRDNRR